MSSESCLVFLIVVVSCHLGGGVVFPGFKTRITKPGLEYANNVAIDVLSKVIIGQAVPDQSGHVSPVTYHLTGLHVTGFNRPTSQILLKSTGLVWAGTNAVIGLHGQWAYKTDVIPISDSGTFDVSAHGLNFIVGMNIAADNNGRPHIKTLMCTVSIGSVSITFHGGASWIYNLFSGEVESVIKSQLTSQICGIVSGLINTDAENALSKLPVTVDLGVFLLDYRMDEQPVYQATFMESFHKGEIDWKATPGAPPFSAPPLPDWNDTSRMMYIWVSDYMINSLLYQAQQHRFLAYNLTAQDVCTAFDSRCPYSYLYYVDRLPLANRSALNTTCNTLVCIGNLIPELAKTYPNCQVDLHMRSTSVPNITVSSADMNAHAEGVIDFFARPVSNTFRRNRNWTRNRNRNFVHQYTVQDNKLAYLFTLNVTMDSAADVQVKNETIYGKLRDVKFNVKLVRSAIKGVDDKVLQFVTDIALNTFVIPTLNGIGAKGLPLPTIENIHFVNPKLFLMQRTMLVATDVVYS